MNFISERESPEFDNNSLSLSSAHSRWKWAQQDVDEAWQGVIYSTASLRKGLFLYRGVDGIRPLTMGNCMVLLLASALSLRAAQNSLICAQKEVWLPCPKYAQSQKGIQMQILCFVPDKHSDPKFPWHLLPENTAPPNELGRQLSSTLLCNHPNSLSVTFFPFLVPTGDALQYFMLHCSELFLEWN